MTLDKQGGNREVLVLVYVRDEWVCVCGDGDESVYVLVFVLIENLWTS
jgi:hypothetical protein